MKDMHSAMKMEVLFAAEALAADNTPVSIDLDGFESAEILIDVGVGGITFSGTNKVEFILTHSVDDSVFVNVTDDDIKGAIGITGGIIKSLIVAHAAGKVYRFGYKGPRRYLKLLADFSGTHGSPTPMAASCALINGHSQPQDDQN